MAQGSLRIKLVLLDWFGVVNGELSKLMIARFGFSQMQQAMVAEINQRSDRGELDVQAVYAGYAALMEQCDGQSRTAAQVKAWLDGYSRVDDDLLAIVDQLRGNGIKVVVASNAATDHRDNLISQLSMLEHFDEIYVSSLIGYDKPNARFFEHILAEQGVTAANTLFIDDSPKNVEGALRAGLYAEQYGEYGDLEMARSIFRKYALL